MFKGKSKVPAFALMGFAAGIISWSGSFFLPDNPAIQQYYPAVVLGIFLYITGRYIAQLKPGNDIVAIIILTIASVIGWRSSIEIGHALGGPLPFVNAGILGALAVALGWLLAWRIRSGILKLIVIVMLAGGLGGAVFQVVDIFLEDNANIWVLILFCEWQSILFAGIAIAHLRK